jgi:hypothetical protein
VPHPPSQRFATLEIRRDPVPRLRDLHVELPGGQAGSPIAANVSRKNQ